jgi:hypothetical protein
VALSEVGVGMAVKSRAELMAEKRAAEAAQAGDTASVRCPGCKCKQRRPADGLCISCGAPLDASAEPAAPKAAEKPEPDPATLRPDSAETKAAMARGALGELVFGLKQEGFDVTLADAEKWGDKERESYAQLVRDGVGKHGVPLLLMEKFVGKGKVPGATKPERVPLESSSASPSSAETAATTATSTASAAPGPRPKSRAELMAEKKAAGGMPDMSHVSTETLPTPGYAAELDIGKGDSRQTTIDDAVKSANKQPMGGDLGPMTELLGKLHACGAKNIDLRMLAKWSPEERNEALRVCEEAISLDRKVRVKTVEGKPTFMAHVPEDRPTDPELEDGLEAEAQAGSLVTVTWGEEKFTLIKDSYSTVIVGPLTMSARTRPGQARADLFLKLNEELAELMEAERDRKIRSFVEKLKSSVREAKGA